jgi:hypothetical protein
MHAHQLTICKKSDPTGPVSGTFSFTISSGGTSTAFSLTPGKCYGPIVGNGPFTITEAFAQGTVVSNISISGSATGTADTGTRTAVVTVGEDVATVTFTNKAAVMGRFTGGGSIFNSAGERITHGFELHCSVSDLPNNLEINNGGNNFHLDTLTSVSCSVDASGVATITGTGSGTFNGVPGYTISFTMTDAGEPGTSDFASYTIVSPAGAVVTSVSGSGFLTFGNQQFHPAPH